MNIWFFALLSGLLPAVFAQDDADGVNQCITPRACFQNNTEPAIVYCITTSWYITYDKRLRSYIQNSIPGYSLIDYKADPDFDKCGWNQGESVSKASVDRGTIFYKSATNSSLDFRPTALVPRVRGAMDMLNKLYPGVEIAVIIICFSVFFWWPIGIALWKIGSALYKGLTKVCKSTATGLSTMFTSLGAGVKSCFSCFRRRHRSQDIREKQRHGPVSVLETPSSGGSSDGWCEKV